MRCRNVTRRLAVFGALALCSYSLEALENCVEQTLPKNPQWISSVELNSEKNQVLISDPKSKELFALDLKSWKMAEIAVPGGLAPSSITKIQGGFLIKDRDDAAILDSSYRTLKEKVNLKNGGGAALGSLYSNWIASGSTFVGFGSVAHFDPSSATAARGFELGFIKGQVSAETGGFRNIQLLEATEENDPYLLGFPYFSATSDGIFFVKMTGPRASIVRVQNAASGGATLAELPAFPNDFRSIPDLTTKNSGPASVAERFEKIEGSRMAAGLFGQGKYLYLLTRQPDPEGNGTEWLLHKIDPNVPHPLDAVRLPTHASHLSVVVGPDYWHFFERGHVRAWGEQDIEKVIRVPATWITNPEKSRIQVDRPEVKCTKK